MGTAIVYRDGAAARFADQRFRAFIFRTENIQCQGFGLAVDVGNRLVECLVGANRQQRAENFFFPYLCRIGNICQDGGVDKTFFAGRFAAERYRGAALHSIVEQGFNAIEMPFVNQPAQVGRLPARVGGFAVKLLDIATHFFYKLVMQGFRHQHIIGCGAELTGIHTFHPGHFGGGYVEVCACIDDNGAFAAEFERNRCQVLCRCLHHAFAYLRASGEKDMVKRQFQQGLGYGGVAFEQADFFRRETLLNDLLHHGRTGGRKFGRFQDHAVAGSHGGHQRIEGQVEGEIPGRQNEAYAFGFVPDFRTGAEGDQRRADLFRAHPAAQTLYGMANFSTNEPHFRNYRFRRAFMQVLPQGRFDFLAATKQGIVQALQFLDALICARTGQYVLVFQLPVKDFLVISGLHRLVDHGIYCLCHKCQANLI